MAEDTDRPLHDLAARRRRDRALSLGVRALALVLAALLAPAAAAQAPAERTLLEIPYPDMEGLEDAVKDQINAAHANLTAWLRQGEPPSDELAAAYGRLGNLLHVYELYEAAAACYLNAVALVPGEPGWVYYLGHVYQESGRFVEAAEAYRAVLEAAPRDLAARVHLGEVLQAQNRPAEAEAELRQALEIAPDDPAAQALLGEIALARGDYRQAVELLSAALARVPAANRLHYPLGMAYRGLGEADKAREHLVESGAVGVTVADPLIAALERLATGERVYLLRGRTAFAAGRYGEAASEFRKALEADPRSARVRVNLGSALGQVGDVVGAVEQYEAALAIDPASVAARFNLGTLAAQEGNDERAVEHFRAAVDLKWDDGESHRQLGLALRRLGRHEEALPHLTEAPTLAPADESAWLDRAILLVDLGRYEEARDVLEEAHRILPQAGGVAHALARLLAGSPDRGLRDGERALDLAQRVYAARATPGHAATVALALAELGRCGEAAQWQETAVKAAAQSGAQELAAQLRPALERYAAGAPCS
jgi:tetratricopeptide (TPR) repeat protein